MLEVFTFRLILEVKGVFTLLLLLYSVVVLKFSPQEHALS